MLTAVPSPLQLGFYQALQFICGVMRPLEMYSDCSIDCKIASVSADKVMHTPHFAAETPGLLYKCFVTVYQRRTSVSEFTFAFIYLYFYIGDNKSSV